MAGKDTQVEQAIEAVKRQPGSPAFAFLAEHYLEEGKEDEALRVCQTGFNANPGFERGAVAYLTVLRGKHDVTTAGDVYGRAIAFLPRSARVRMAWALILADAGKEREARNVAREALDLDPLNREARAFVATLGGTPAPHPVGRPPASPTARLAALAKDAVFDDSDLSTDGQPPKAAQAGPKAEVRPWIRPIGQRTTPHKMFDLTPVPSAMDPKDRAELRGRDVAISPVPEAHVDVPMDLFEEPDAEPKDRRSTELGLGPSRPRSASLAPPPPASVSRGSFNTLRASMTPPPSPSERAPSLTTLSPEPVSTAVTDDAPTRESVPLPRGELQVEPPIEPAEPPEPPRRTGGAAPLAMRPRVGFQRQRQRWLIIGLAVLVLAGAAYLGMAYFRAASFERGVDRAVSSLYPDLPSAYVAARQELARLHRSRPENTRVGAALALVDAHLAVRFSAGEGADRRARELLAGLPAPGRPEHAAVALAILAAAVALAILEIAAGRPAEAAKVLQPRVVSAAGWHGALASARTAVLQGQRDAAADLYEGALRLQPSAPGLLEDAAVFQRRAGLIEQARRSVVEGLRASPEHPGLRIQEALLGDPPPQPKIRELVHAAGQIGRLRASALLLDARQARRRGDMAAAARLLEEAMRLDPHDPEAGTQLASWRLEPGGDAAQAASLLEKHAPAMSRFRPAVRLELAHALLLLGRPQEARRELQAVSAVLGGAEKRRLQALEITAAHLADDLTAVEKGCQSPGDNADRAAACAEALLERGRTTRVAALLRAVVDKASLAYLNGLRSLAQGDTRKAIALLGKTGEPALDPAAPVLALARAQARQGGAAEAAKLLRAAVARDARSVRSRVALAVALVGAGHDTEAQGLLESLLADRPTQPSLLVQAGEAFLTMGLPAKASALVEQGIKQDAGSVQIRLLAGRVAQANRQPDQAKRHFNEVLRRDPRHPEALVELGRIEEASGQGAQARKRFAAALKLRPKDPELLFLVARVQARGGDARAALANGNKAIKLLKGTDQEARAQEMMLELGKHLAQGDKFAKKRAEELFFEATKPKNAPAPPFLELGRLYRSQNDHNRAIWCFRQALERDPNLADAYLELGRSLRTKPQWRKDAKAAFRRYLKLKPDGKEAAKVRTIVEKLH